MLERTKQLLAGKYAPPTLLLIIALLAHGLVIPRLGFYWDDWPNMWFLSRQGPSVFPAAFASDRPFLGMLYMLTTPLLGTVPWRWQAFGLFTRWLSALAVLWTVRQLWPGRPRTALAVAAVFLVYPGFRQGPISVIYSHAFVLMTSSFVSLGAMLKAARGESRRRWTVLGLFAAAVSLFSDEYFVGYELLRPLLVWIACASGRPTIQVRVRRMSAVWAPYLVLFGTYLVWRVFLWGFPTYQPVGLAGVSSGGWAGLAAVGQHMANAMMQSAILAWVGTLRLPSVASFGFRSSMVAGVVGLGLAMAVFLHFALGGEKEGGDSPHSDGRGHRQALPVIALGLAAMIAGGLPIWVSGLPLALVFPWDRLTLPMMLGVSLLTVGVVEILLRNRVLRALLLAVLIGLAGRLHIQTAISFARDWDVQRDLLWQMTWRMPAIRAGTTLLTNDISKYMYESDNSLTGPLNWTYAPGKSTLELDYLFAFVSVRLGKGIPAAREGLPIIQGYRAAGFRGSTSDLIAAMYDPPGCFHVLDVVLDDSMPTIPKALSDFVPLSRLDLIDPHPPRHAVPPSIVGAEPGRNWCYYFEHADLARQEGDWDQVASLGDVAFTLTDHPNDASEHLPFIEGYAHVGRWERAMELTDEAMMRDAAILPMLCNTWRRLGAELASDAGAKDRVDDVNRRLGCGSP
jgi:hypothetical protein